MKKIVVMIFLILSAICLAEEIVSDSLNVKPDLIFMEFGSTKCIPCIQMEEVMEQIKEHYPQSVEVIFTNVMKERNKAKEYDVRVIPTQIILDAEGNEIFRHKGYFPFEDIQKLFEENGVTPAAETTGD